MFTHQIIVKLDILKFVEEIFSHAFTEQLNVLKSISANETLKCYLKILAQ